MRQSYLEVVSPALRSEWLEGGQSHHHKIERAGSRYAVVSFGDAPLLWVSCDDHDTYGVFRRFFDSLNLADAVKPLIDHDRDIVLYCGFFVISSHADEETWHEDYQAGSNGLTFLTPLFEFDPAHGDLLYEHPSSGVGRYAYRMGEAILLGDNFDHSTGIYPRADRLRVIVSMTLGTDKMKYWPILEGYLRGQSDFLILPCGHRLGTCDDLPG